MSVLDEIAGYLATNGLGSVGTNIFKSGLMPSPDVQIALIQTGGQPPIHAMDDSGDTATDRITLQILSRGARDNYPSAFAPAQSAYLLLDDVAGEVISGGYYKAIQPLQPPFAIDIDDNGRSVVAFNVLARRRR